MTGRIRDLLELKSDILVLDGHESRFQERRKRETALSLKNEHFERIF